MKINCYHILRKERVYIIFDEDEESTPHFTMDNFDLPKIELKLEAYRLPTPVDLSPPVD